MSGYVYWWIQFLDAGHTVQCALCGDERELSGPAMVATAESEAFIADHRACGGDAA